MKQNSEVAESLGETIQEIQNQLREEQIYIKQRMHNLTNNWGMSDERSEAEELFRRIFSLTLLMEEIIECIKKNFQPGRAALAVPVGDSLRSLEYTSHTIGIPDAEGDTGDMEDIRIDKKKQTRYGDLFADDYDEDDEEELKKKKKGKKKKKKDLYQMEQVQDEDEEDEEDEWAWAKKKKKKKKKKDLDGKKQKVRDEDEENEEDEWAWAKKKKKVWDEDDEDEEDEEEYVTKKKKKKDLGRKKKKVWDEDDEDEEDEEEEYVTKKKKKKDGKKKKK